MGGREEVGVPRPRFPPYKYIYIIPSIGGSIPFSKFLGKISKRSNYAQKTDLKILQKN